MAGIGVWAGAFYLSLILAGWHRLNPVALVYQSPLKGTLRLS